MGDQIKTSGTFMGLPRIKTTSQKVHAVLDTLMSWGIRILLIVMAAWLYALTTASLMKYLGS